MASHVLTFVYFGCPFDWHLKLSEDKFLNCLVFDVYTVHLIYSVSKL